MPPVVRMVSPEGGDPVDIPEADAQIFIDRGWTPQSNAARAAQVVEGAREEYFTTPAQQVRAGLAGVARTATGGLSDVIGAAAGAREELEGLREHNAGLSVAAEIGGAFLPTGLGNLAAKAGSRVARIGAEGGALSKIAGATAGGTVEGGIFGAGTAVSELALSDDPLTLEHAASTLKSHVLFGGGIGGGVSAVTKGLEVSLARANAALERSIASRAAKPEELVTERASLADDITGYRDDMREAKIWLATKGADDAELRVIGKQNLKATKQLDNILDNPKALAQNPGAALNALQKQEHALEQLGEIGRAIPSSADEITDGLTTTVRARTLKARGIEDDVVDDAVSLAQAEVKRAEGELRQLESRRMGKAPEKPAKPGTKKAEAEAKKAEERAAHEAKKAEAEASLASSRKALEEAEAGVAAETAAARRAVEAGEAPAVRATVGPDGRIAIQGGRRHLDAAIELDRPIAVQWQRGTETVRDRVRREIAAGKVEGELASANPEALERAVNREMLRRSGSPDATPSVRATAMQWVQPALEKNRALQERIGQLAKAPEAERAGLLEKLLGGAAAVGVPGAGVVAGKMSRLIAAGRDRIEKAASKVLAVGSAGAAKASRVAPVLATRVLSRARFSAEGRAAEPAGDHLAHSYKARTQEIRDQVAPGPDGRLAMRPDARAKIAAKLAPIGVRDPIAADRLETSAVRRLEHLANTMPRRPELAGMAFGPDRWQPSEMEMRGWARIVAAVEDPHTVFDRVADGSITPEDVDALRAVYPEMLADFTQQVVAKLPELRDSLPYQRRLALSILTGVPVDPAMDPTILSALQASFVNEPGTAGGTQAPMPTAQFGSVKAPEPTPAQKRAG